MISSPGRAWLFALSTGALALALAGCGTSATPPASSTTTSAPATTSTALSGSSGVSGPVECSTGVLEASATFGGAAAGTSYFTVSMKNAGPAPCTLDGYPSYKFLAPSGAGGAGAGSPVSLSVTHGGPAAKPVRVNPGSSADSLIVYSDVAAGGANCPNVASALLTPPGSSESVTFPIAFSPCGGGVTAFAFGAPGSESP